MLRKILSVGGFTLLSRLTGFIRDVIMAAVMGAGPIADAFVVAFRLPNHFRAIFGEGAFNVAFVPAYARIRETEGHETARLFSDRLWTVTSAVQVLVLALALLFMPTLVAWLAPGFPDEPEKYALAINLTRITFPYLLFISLTTLVSGELNAIDRFAAAAGAPILLNLSMAGALALAFLFPNAGYAAAWSVTISGMLQLGLVVWDAERVGIGPRFARPVLDDDMRAFLKALGPAVIGSAGVQIAMFADTIIASLLPTGAVSSIYYADRLYQLPLGVIGIAAGTVVLPEMSRLLARGDAAGAHRAQNRAVALSLALAMPFAVGFALVPDLVMRALFERGAFTAEDAARAGAVLAAYSVGLPAIVLIRSAVASFYSRGDTTTPLIASLTAVACNVGLKILLVKPFGAAGLALATAAGAWINFTLLAGLAWRRDWTAPSPTLLKIIGAVIAAGAALALALILVDPVAAHAAAPFGHFALYMRLAFVGLAGLLAYGATLAVLLRLGGVKAREV